MGEDGALGRGGIGGGDAGALSWAGTWGSSSVV